MSERPGDGDASGEEVVAPEDVELLGAAAVARGRAHYLAGDLRQAAEAFGAAAAEDPGDPDAFLGLAKAVRHADPSRARDALVRAIRLRPASFEAWRALASTLRAAGDAAGLARALEGARRAAPSADAAAGLALDFPTDDRP